MQLRDVSGLHYNPLTRSVMLGGNVQVNYLAHACKPDE
jgi:2-polyprenyl-3-methyl-5-hydroxy-6-metoxy-1,4-benzoquinol methylase